jgi:hypothetical protein
MGANNFGPLPFQAHLTLAREFFSLDIVPWVPPFMHFIEKGLDQFLKNISNKLHDHSFFNIISDMASNLHCACLKSYTGLKVGA